MIGGSRHQAQDNRAGEISVVLGSHRRQSSHDGERNGAEPQRKMRPFAHLVEKSGGEHGEKKRDPEDRVNRVQPSAEKAASDNSCRHHQGQAEPAAERSLGIGQRQEQAGDAADQGGARLSPQNSDQDRQSDIGEEHHAAARLEFAP